MGSTEHEDSGMEDILDSIRRIISDEPLENELPQTAVAQVTPQVAAPATNTSGGPGSTGAQLGAGGAIGTGIPGNPSVAAAPPPNAIGLNTAPPLAPPAPASPPPANNANVTSQLANALEKHPPQPAPLAPVTPAAAPGNAAPYNTAIHNPLNSQNGDDVMDLTHPVSGPVTVPVSQAPAQASGIAPTAPIQPAAHQTATVVQTAQTSSAPTSAPTINEGPPRPMPMRTPVEGLQQAPETPLQPQAKLETGEEPAIASMTSQQFGSPVMNGSPTPVLATPDSATQPSPAQAAPAQAAPPTVNPLPTDNKPVWRDDADATPQTTDAIPKSNGINALNDALVGVSIAAPHAQSPAEHEVEETTADLNSPAKSLEAHSPDQSGEKVESLDASPAADMPNEVAKLSPTEQAMHDLLKPMIKTWLDENMPRMVEEVLREEVRLALKSDD